MSTTRIDVACDVLPGRFRVLGIQGTEGINVVSRWELRLLCPDGGINPDEAVGARAKLQIIDEPEGTARAVGLVVVSVTHDGEGRDGAHFTVALSPPEALLTLRSGYEVFIEKKTKEIVTELLQRAGIPGDQVTWRLSGEYQRRLHCVQYGETEWGFIERLLADEGISYWFEADDDGKTMLLFTDAANGHDKISGSLVIPYEDPGGVVAYRHFNELEVVGAITTTAVHVRDYDLRAPDVLLEGKAGEGALEYFEYPAGILDAGAARSRATARLEQLQRMKVHALASSNCIRLQPGRVVAVDACADEAMNGEYLIVRVEHALSMGAQNDASPTSYRNKVTLVPRGEMAFRPELPRKVRIEGLEPATTTGPAGQEIHVDDLARVKIRFPWDRSGVTDDRSSMWVRCMQMNMSGTMLLPRVGWEVAVAYIDGNPDQPFVLGREYNATAVVPYSLPASSATTTFQSATSPGGGSTNEIRMGDGAGKQEMFVHASKDQTVTVGGSATSSVGVNETHDVGLSLIGKITGTQSLTVGASQSVNVGTEYAITIDGGRTELVGGMELMKITGNRTVAVGGAHCELIGAFYGIQCNQANASVKGAFTELVGGSMGLAGGIGVTETVIAARTELVGGAKSLVAAKAFSEKVRGAKVLIAGATTEKAGAKVVTDTKVAGRISVGGSATMKAGGPVVIEAPSITIQAASLEAGPLSLSGGAAHFKGGKSKFEGNIKRSGGAHLEK